MAIFSLHKQNKTMSGFDVDTKGLSLHQLSKTSLERLFYAEIEEGEDKEVLAANDPKVIQFFADVASAISAGRV